MKKIQLASLIFVVAAGLTACNEGENTTQATNVSDSTVNLNTTPDPLNGTTNTGAPLNAQDSTFVMTAAAGGMMEVEAGNAAQQNAQHERVKNYGAMMVQDHSKANQELMSLASSRGMTVPTTLPADKQTALQNLQSKNGRAFDTQYMSMMVEDHQKTIADFEKQANSGSDAELKSWAANKLPALRMHLDSARAISGAIK